MRGFAICVMMFSVCCMLTLSVQIAFAGHVAEMAGPVEQVHVDRGGVGQLDEEYLVAGNGPDRIRVNAAAQSVETVHNQPDIRVIGAAHDLPSIAVIVDMGAPGQRLEPDPQTASGRPLAQFPEVFCCTVDSSERRRMDRHRSR